MITEEMERLYQEPLPLDLERHQLEAPLLTMRRMFYPMGFPVEVRTNSPQVLELGDEIWSIYERRFEFPPVIVDVHVVKGGTEECPPAPTYRVVQPLFIAFADGDNYSIADLDRGTTQVVITEAALKHKDYQDYFFIGAAPLSHLCVRYGTQVHAACVALDGIGVLLCGHSGAGKSSLAFACARAGWTYITDDFSLMMHGGDRRVVTGNYHKVRFRPSGAALFPELFRDPGILKLTPRAAGKPSIEMLTEQIHGMVCAPSAEVNFVVFLNRTSEGAPGLRAFSRDKARQLLRQVLFGPPQWRTSQHAGLEQLLTAGVFELRYTDLDWAVERLETLVREGR